MAKIKSIRSIGCQPVFNMTVDDVHNFLIDGNVIVKNCDSLRYFSVFWTVPPEALRREGTKRWTEDMWEDYKNANDSDKQILVAKWGEPR